jgi:hypothetical protein
MTFTVLIGTYGGPSLLALTVILILTGRLVPRKNLKDMERDRDLWREAYNVSEQSRRLEAEHTGQLLEAARASAMVLRSLPAVPSEAGDNAHVVAQKQGSISGSPPGP